MQPSLDLGARLLCPFSLQGKQYAVSFAPVFHRIARQNLALGAEFLNRLKRTTGPVAAVGIEGHDPFSREIMLSQKALDGRRQLHPPRWEADEDDIEPCHVSRLRSQRRQKPRFIFADNLLHGLLVVFRIRGFQFQGKQSAAHVTVDIELPFVTHNEELVANNTSFNPSRRWAFSLINCSDIQLSNFTINNYAIGQAEALMVRGQRIVVDHMTLNGSGDALTTYGTIYFADSKLTGDGDTVLGYAAVYFLRSEIRSRGPISCPPKALRGHSLR